MASRVEAHDSLDYFPTPPFATRALCELLLSRDMGPLRSALDPAAGEGWMARPLAEYFDEVRAADVHDYGAGYPVVDFLFPGGPVGDVDWIITNPPFRMAQEFIAVARRRARMGVAMLVRLSFLEGQKRYHNLYVHDPPDIVAPFVERVLMLKGRVAQLGGVDPLTGRKTATATAYCWMVWFGPPEPDRSRATQISWIPPCRRQLERVEDYQ